MIPVRLTAAAARGRWIAGVVLALSLAACAAAEGNRPIPRSGDISRPANLFDLMLSARETPAYRDTGVSACIRQGSSGGSLSEFLPVMAAMMDVPPQDSVDAFCHAVVEAAVAGDFAEADIRAMYKPYGDRDYRIFGRFLRALLVAHERLQTALAERRPAVTAGPLS